jgi:site-specific recombinase XerD
MTLDELFSIYTRKRLRMRSPNTIRLYRHSIAAFEKTLGRTATTEDLTDDNMEQHMQRVVESGLSPASANKDLYQIGAIWRFGNRNRMCETWPNVQIYPEPERVPMAWLPEELDRLFVSVEQEQGTISGAPACLWWKTLLCVLLDCGERIGAIMRCTRDNIHGSYLLVPACHRKGKTRDKLFELSVDTLEMIAALTLAHRYSELFPWDRSETHIYYRYTQILKRANLPSDAKSKFHRLRRTVASAVKNQGGDATAAMDHASSATTKRYLDPRLVGDVSTYHFVTKWRRKKKVSK